MPRDNPLATILDILIHKIFRISRCMQASRRGARVCRSIVIERQRSDARDASALSARRNGPAPSRVRQLARFPRTRPRNAPMYSSGQHCCEISMRRARQPRVARRIRRIPRHFAILLKLCEFPYLLCDICHLSTKFREKTVFV